MDLASLVPLPGGWSGETFLGESAGERCVVRVYGRPSHRGPEAATVDAALLRLVRGLVPVPAVLELIRARGRAPAVLVTELMPGTRAELVLPELDDTGAAVLGRHLGELAATLAGMPLLGPGRFVDGNLTVEAFGSAEDLPDWVEAHTEALTWPADLVGSLLEVARDAQGLLDSVPRTCLVHSDLNLKNVLVDPDTLAVTALVDWEYAHAGHPFTDLGNLLRFERRPAFAEAALAAYAERHALDPARALDLARAADLWALVELAARAGENPVVQQASALVRRIAETGDLHA